MSKYSDDYNGIKITKIAPLKCSACKGIRIVIGEYQKRYCVDCNNTEELDGSRKSMTSNIEDMSAFNKLRSTFEV